MTRDAISMAVCRMQIQASTRILSMQITNNIIPDLTPPLWTLKMYHIMIIPIEQNNARVTQLDKEMLQQHRPSVANLQESQLCQEKSTAMELVMLTLSKSHTSGSDGSLEEWH